MFSTKIWPGEWKGVIRGDNLNTWSTNQVSINNKCDCMMRNLHFYQQILQRHCRFSMQNSQKSNATVIAAAGTEGDRNEVIRSRRRVYTLKSVFYTLVLFIKSMMLIMKILFKHTQLMQTPTEHVNLRLFSFICIQNVSLRPWDIDNKEKQNRRHPYWNQPIWSWFVNLFIHLRHSCLHSLSRSLIDFWMWELLHLK
jgi:hypothetical protein